MIKIIENLKEGIILTYNLTNGGIKYVKEVSSSISSYKFGFW